MNKKAIITLITMVVLVLVIAGVFVFVKKSNGSKELELTYKTNGGVPYKWEYKIEDESIVKCVKQYEVDKNKGKLIDGGEVELNYVFKGLKKGETTITFKYVSIVDGSVSKEEKTTVKVDSFKNISLVATK